MKITVDEYKAMMAGGKLPDVDGVRTDRQNIITISINGDPPGKPRMTQRDKWAKRPCVVRYREWCDKARRVLEGPLPPSKMVESLEITAFFDVPKSWTKKRKVQAIGTPHRAKPDLDNIFKAVSDVFWPDDDSGIAVATTKKIWSERGRLVVTIHLMPH